MLKNTCVAAVGGWFENQNHFKEGKRNSASPKHMAPETLVEHQGDHLKCKAGKTLLLPAWHYVPSTSVLEVWQGVTLSMWETPNQMKGMQ